MKRSIVSTLAVVVLLTIVGCKKTEKGESNRFERELERATALAVAHPAFKPAIDEQRSKAEAAMKSARDVSDKKQRIDAMAAANRMLSGGFIGDLSSAEETIKTIRQQMVALSGDAETEAEKAALAEAKIQVDRTLAEVDRTLAAGASTASAAQGVMTKVKGELQFADKALAGIAKRVADRKGEAAASDKAAADEAAAKEKAAADAVANWTCSFCDHSNVHDATKCANCGADKSPK